MSEGYREGLLAQCHGLKSSFELFCFAGQNCELQLYDFSSREGCMELPALEHVFSQAAWPKKTMKPDFFLWSERNNLFGLKALEF